MGSPNVYRNFSFVYQVNFTLLALVSIAGAAAVKRHFVDRDAVLIHAAAILEPLRFSECSLVKDSR